MGIEPTTFLTIVEHLVSCMTSVRPYSFLTFSFRFVGSFLCQFIKACASTKLRELPLVYVTYGLSQLPPLPLLGSEALAAIR